MKGFFNKRRLQLLELIARNESMAVKDLSDLLNVTEATIRTDLDVLEENGKIVRFHGGARLIENRHKQEFDYQNRKKLNFHKKLAIGAVAAEFVNSNESIMLDASTTSFAMVQSLRNRDDLRFVTVIPFGIWSAVELLGYEHFNILLSGGYLHHSSDSITGVTNVDFFEGLHVQKAFLGAWGVSVKEGFSDRHLQDVELKKMMIKKAKEVVVMVDGSKFSQSGVVSYAEINNVSKIITDKSAPMAVIDNIRSLGVEVIVANNK
ncbi:MAG: DeoR/GlpR family DNA-binding transcription regulator [Bacteroidota bacterium]